MVIGVDVNGIKMRHLYLQSHKKHIPGEGRQGEGRVEGLDLTSLKEEKLG